MTEEKLKEFNEDLKVLLEKHQVTLSIGQQIVVNDAPKDEKETKPNHKNG